MSTAPAPDISKDRDALLTWKQDLERDAIGREPTPARLLEAELVAAMLDDLEARRLAA